MSAVDLPADVPAQSTSYKSIRSKMLIAGDASKCHSGSQAVRKQLGERPRILVREHAGSRPGENRVLGWKGISATKKRAVTVALKRTLALRDSFQCESNRCAVDHGLAREKSCLTQMIVASQVPP